VYRIVKRFLDLGICLLIMPVILVVLAVISIAILLDSPGPVLFVQERAGRNGRRFRMYKFRTMKNNYHDDGNRNFMKAYIRGQIGDVECDQSGAVYKPNHKEAITRVGRFLRKTSLDELPQIFNVLRNEMSLVGPRPHVVWEVEEYCDWHRERLRVLPGVTGLAQVHGRSNISFDQMARYDIEYVRKQSVKLDVEILYRTVLSVLKTRGAA
jgi:lipopolysaccharide/colanic/teichoic acid biosynthesis glycosyltransferase